MKTRVISAAILILIFVPLLLLGGIYFKVLATILSIIGLYELIKMKDKKNTLPLSIKLISYVFVILFCISNSSLITASYKISYQLIAVLIFSFLFPMIFINNNEKYNIQDALFLVSSILFIGFSFNLLILIRNYDINYIFYLLLITTITDTFAYITGSLIGKNKLCPKISPKKTIEGLIGGTFIATFVAVAFYHNVIDHNLPIYIVIIMTMILSLVGQIGDLVFSFIKRYYGKKDFSNIIPGHGGILDRFDSLIFVVLAFIILIEFI